MSTPVKTINRPLDKPIADLVNQLLISNPEAKIETHCIDPEGVAEPFWRVSVLGEKLNLFDTYQQPQLSLLDVNIKRTGRFARAVFMYHVRAVDSANTPLSTALEQYQALCDRLGVDSLIIVGLVHQQEHEPVLMTIETTPAVTLGDVHGITQRLMNDVNSGYASQGKFPPFPYASPTGQSGPPIITTERPKLITLR